MLIRNLGAAIRIVILLSFAGTVCGCTIAGLAIGSAIDGDSAYYVELEDDSLAALTPGDTIRVDLGRKFNYTVYQTAIFQSYDPEAGAVNALKDDTPVRYSLDVVGPIELVHRKDDPHQARKLGACIGLLIDLAIVLYVDSTWEPMGDMNFSFGD